MPEAQHVAVRGSETVRAAGVGCCGVCGAPLKGKQRVACSDPHRAELARRRQTEVQRSRDDEVRTLLRLALKRLEDSTG